YLVGRASNAEAMFVSHQLIFVDVELHQCWGESMRQIRWNAANRARLSLNVEERNAAFGCCIEFEDPRNPKPLFEFVPNVGRQSVAAGHPDAMANLIRSKTCIQQVATKLADVLKGSAVPANDVIPEL